MVCPRSAPIASSGHRRHWDCRAAASRCRPADLSLVDAPARRAQDRGIVLLIAPLAFFMGMPFLLALVRVAAARPALVPWVWGINGCASVLSAILAILLAMSLGFNAVVLIAIGLYVVAAATLR
jgi:hypothetical protein